MKNPPNVWGIGFAWKVSTFQSHEWEELWVAIPSLATPSERRT